MTSQLYLPNFNTTEHSHIYVYPTQEGRTMKVTGYCRICGMPKDSISNYGLQEALYMGSAIPWGSNRTRLSKMMERLK
jgi:hypothetical protein